MIIRDRIKEHITTQITPYLESGCTLTFNSENKTGSRAAQSTELPVCSLEWPYKYIVSVSKFLGEQMDISHAAFDELIETYRKLLGKEMAKRTEITLGIGSYVTLKSVNVEWIEENKWYYTIITLEYSHIEEY
jgi:hypothetical protein